VAKEKDLAAFAEALQGALGSTPGGGRGGDSIVHHGDGTLEGGHDAGTLTGVPDPKLANALVTLGAAHSLRDLPQSTRDYLYNRIYRSAAQLPASVAAEWAAAKRDRNGVSQVSFLKRWAAAEVADTGYGGIDVPISGCSRWAWCVIQKGMHACVWRESV
jgi:hypothetical protein